MPVDYLDSTTFSKAAALLVAGRVLVLRQIGKSPTVRTINSSK